MKALWHFLDGGGYSIPRLTAKDVDKTFSKTLMRTLKQDGTPFLSLTIGSTTFLETQLEELNFFRESAKI